MKVLKSHKFAPVRVGGFAPRYNWSSLLDGKIRQLELDDLAGLEPKKFRSSLRKAAAKQGWKINSEITEDDEGNETGLIVEAVPMTDEEKAEYKRSREELKARRKARKAEQAESNGDGDDEDGDEE